MKGGGATHTPEKALAAAAERFVVIVSSNKVVEGADSRRLPAWWNTGCFHPGWFQRSSWGEETESSGSLRSDRSRGVERDPYELIVVACCYPQNWRNPLGIPPDPDPTPRRT